MHAFAEYAEYEAWQSCSGRLASTDNDSMIALVLNAVNRQMSLTGISNSALAVAETMAREFSHRDEY
eukprot:2609498-Pleurochrysis_carterae.AAC.1